MKSKHANPIRTLQRQIRDRFPEAAMELDAPAKANGVWHLDIDRNQHFVFVQWQRRRGFGISCSPEHAFGEGPDEVYSDPEAAYARIVCLLIARTYTSPPPAVQLRELRKQRGISQEELAKMLKVGQAAVSKLEARSDALVSTIRAVVKSMGGTVRIIASFPDGLEKVLQLGQERDSDE